MVIMKHWSVREEFIKWYQEVFEKSLIRHPLVFYEMKLSYSWGTNK